MSDQNRNNEYIEGFDAMFTPNKRLKQQQNEIMNKT
jgi:hypothetical protein